MTARPWLIVMTAVAVVSDSMLNPFFPQYFSTVLGVEDPRHVGYYIASCSLVVLLAFPVWARIARRVPLVRLLIATQLAAGALSLASGYTTSLGQFWIFSLAMLVCKASYLLIYPHILSLERKANHLATISLLAFVLYFGRIASALMSGAVFQLGDPRWLFVVMAGGDLVQTVMCGFALSAAAPVTAAEPAPERSDRDEPVARLPARRLLYKLGIVMLMLYFSAYLTQPFFSAYWTELVGTDNKILSGAVFAVPGIAAVCALYGNARAHTRARHAGIGSAIVLAIAGLVLQRIGEPLLVVVGRGLYGWALFQSMVRLDVVVFRLSTPAAYAVDFSTINLYQGLGVLFASYAAGALVGGFGVTVPFAVSVAGFGVTVALYFGLLHAELRLAAAPPSTVAASAVDHPIAQEAA